MSPRPLKDEHDRKLKLLLADALWEPLQSEGGEFPRFLKLRRLVARTAYADAKEAIVFQEV